MKNPDRFNAFLSRVPQATEWQRIGNQINATMILARANLVNVCSARHSAEIQSQRAVRRKACRNRRWHVPKPLERPSQMRGPAAGKFRISRGVSSAKIAVNTNQPLDALETRLELELKESRDCP